MPGRVFLRTLPASLSVRTVRPQDSGDRRHCRVYAKPVEACGWNGSRFPSEQWTLNSTSPGGRRSIVLLHQAVQLSKARAKEPAYRSTRMRAEVEAWQSDDAKTADDIAVLIFLRF